MLKVSEKFKKVAKAPVKTLEARVTFTDKNGGNPTVFTSGDNLISVGLEQTGELFNAAMATATVKVLGTDYDLKDKVAKIEVSLVTDGDVFTNIDDLTYMQDFSELTRSEFEKVKASMTEEQAYSLQDKRDGMAYRVAKLKDGKIWMTDSLNLEGGRVLTSADSDVPDDKPYTMPVTTQLGTAGVNNTDANAEVAIKGKDVMYYSWSTAAAGTQPRIGQADCSSMPKGWTLPSADDFKTLLVHYPTPESLTGAEGPGFGLNGWLAAGSVEKSTINAEGTGIANWASTVTEDNEPTLLIHLEGGSAGDIYQVRPQGSANRFFDIRGIVREPAETDDDSSQQGPTLDYGSFDVDETPVALDKETTTIRLYDAMARIQNELYNVGSIDFPITVSALAKAVADQFQLSISDTSTLPNAAYEIKEPLYDTISNLNYRNILAEVAGATATLAKVDRVDQQIVFAPPQTESLETLTYANLKTVELKDHYGPVNSVVIARTPQEDNIAVTDDESIDANGLTEVKLANNEIMDDEREVFAQPILDVVDGLEWTGFECTTEGHGWYEAGDRLTITDDTNSWEVVVTDVSLTIDGGFKETLKGVIPTATTTDYALAGGIMRTIYNTEIKVDKQNQTIESVVSRQDAFEGEVTEQFSRIEQNLTSITTTIQTTGGGNLIHNSVGYNVSPDKKLVNWEQTGTVGSSSSPESRSYGAISGSQIDMGKSSTLKQRINVDSSGSQVYTLSFKAKKSISGTVKVHLENEIDDYVIELPAGKEVLWESFSQVAIQPKMNYLDVVIETDAELASFSITDLLLCVGDSTIPWVAASDEILSKSVAVDGTGVTVRSSTSNDYVKLDELGLNGYSDAGGSMENVFTINRDTTEVMKLTAKKQIAMPPLRIVPMQDGWAFVPMD